MNLPSLFRSNNQSTRVLSRIQNDFDRLFSELTNMEPLLKTDFSCNCEVLEDAESYTFKFDMPGVKKQDVKVELDGNVMTVSAERMEEKKNGEKNRYSEVSYGSYQRAFTLPEAVKDEKIDAKFDNGVLTLTVPKTKSANTKQIAIQ